MFLVDLRSPNFDFRFWGARGAPKGAPKIEVHGTYPCMVSSKHPGTPTRTIFVHPPENQLMLWNVSDGPWGTTGNKTRSHRYGNNRPAAARK